jgi:hypothetical protein
MRGPGLKGQHECTTLRFSGASNGFISREGYAADLECSAGRVLFLHERWDRGKSLSIIDISYLNEAHSLDGK